MSELIQSGLHPDADQLNAFIEQALPAHEREETLAHLAVCGECRAVVALSLPAFEEAMPVAVSELRWFKGWAVAWPVAALAALILLTLELRTRVVPRHEGPVQQHAAVVPPARPLPPAIATPPPPVAEVRRPGVVPPGRIQTAHETKEPAAIIASKQVEQLQLEGRNVAPLLHISQGVEANAPMRFGSAAGMGLSPAPSANNGTPGGVSTENGAPVAPQSFNAQSAQTVNVAAAAPTVLLSTQNASLDALQIADDVSSASVAPLPSGLPALSVAANAHQRVALDARGGLFASSDDGAHWSAVPVQWQGRVVRVAAAGTTFAKMRPLGFAAGSLGLAAGDASLEGTVTDALGAAIAGADVTLSLGSTVIRTVKTDAAGTYRAGGLAAGSYRVDASATGFKMQTVTVDVTASQRATENLTLAVGSTSQTVTVSAAEMEVAPVAGAVKPNSGLVGKKMKRAQQAFEMTTDTGERWTSVDGTSWKRE